MAIGRDLEDTQLGRQPNEERGGTQIARRQHRTGPAYPLKDYYDPPTIKPKGGPALDESGRDRAIDPSKRDPRTKTERRYQDNTPAGYESGPAATKRQRTEEGKPEPVEGVDES